MKEMSKFQLVLTGVFGACILLGVLIFSLGKFGSGQSLATVVVWGPLPSSYFSDLVTAAGLKDSKTIKIDYVQKDEAKFEKDFIEALASNQGPDLFFLPQDLILKYKNKIFPIPYKNFPERNFKDTFIEEGELYLAPEGVLAVPFTVDPLVMYWNRTIFSNVGLGTPPKFWSEFYDLTPRLTTKDGALNVRQSAIAFGEYGNVSHATEILSTLIMQAGGVISGRQNGEVVSFLQYKFNSPVLPATAALGFYTEFINPLKPFYSWNRSLPSSRNYFISGDLATYFGYASEIADIQNKNPNLNFDVAKMPQSTESEKVLTFGKMNALAVTKASKNIAPAVQVAMLFSSQPVILKLSELTKLPPVRRDLLTQKPTDAFMSIFYDSAIQSRGWLQPDRAETNTIFKEMIESVTAGRRTAGESVQRTDEEINLLFGSGK